MLHFGQIIGKLLEGQRNRQTQGVININRADLDLMRCRRSLRVLEARLPVSL